MNQTLRNSTRPEPSPATGCAGETIVGLGVEQLEDALAGGHGCLQDVVFVAEVLDGAEEALRVLDEGDEDAEGDRAEDASARRSVAVDSRALRSDSSARRRTR